MKTEAEIQRAHDMLAGIVLGETPGVEVKHLDRMVAALDVLCWVLEHEHNTNFVQNLKKAEEATREAGIFCGNQTEMPIDINLKIWTDVTGPNTGRVMMSVDGSVIGRTNNAEADLARQVKDAIQKVLTERARQTGAKLAQWDRGFEPPKRE